MKKRKAQMKAGWFAGRVLTSMILILIYYMVITPLALLKRVINGRPLPFKPDNSLSSYWVPRQEPAQPRERFMKRY